MLAEGALFNPGFPYVYIYLTLFPPYPQHTQVGSLPPACSPGGAPGPGLKLCITCIYHKDTTYARTCPPLDISPTHSTHNDLNMAMR